MQLDKLLFKHYLSVKTHDVTPSKTKISKLV